MPRQVVQCLICGLTTSCHVVSQLENTRPGATQHLTHPEGAIPRKPTVVLTEHGQLRFVEPLECPAEDIVEENTSAEVTTGPNLATFVVGVIATGIGGVLTVRGAFDASTGPYLYGGLASLAVGLPLAVGPWLGNRTVLVARQKLTPVRHPAPSEPCGARPLAARSATLTVHGIEMYGAVDRDGMFAISPYQLVDAYEPTKTSAWDLAGVVDAEGGPRTVAAVIESRAIASMASAFLAQSDVDTKIEPMHLVPGLVSGALHVSLTSTPDGPALRVVLPLKNDGPGDAWAVRGQISSPNPAIDGRMMYVGHLAKRGAVARELLIPLTREREKAIRAADLDLSIELRDAYGTAPAVPVRYRGPVMVDGLP